MRVTADGALQACLGGAARVGLRELVCAGAPDEAIELAVRGALAKKAPRHQMEEAGAGLVQLPPWDRRVIESRRGPRRYPRLLSSSYLAALKISTTCWSVAVLGFVSWQASFFAFSAIVAETWGVSPPSVATALGSALCVEDADPMLARGERLETLPTS